MAEVLARTKFDKSYNQSYCIKKEKRKVGNWVWFPPCENRNALSVDSRLVSIEDSRKATIPLTGGSYRITSLTDDFVSLEKIQSSDRIKAR